MAVIIIIGVVAAITIPSAIKNIEKTHIETRFKIAYSILSRAVDMAEVENGPSNTWTFHDNSISSDKLSAKMSREVAEKYFIPYLNISYICDYPDNIKKCFADTSWHNSAGFIVGPGNGYDTQRGYSFRLKNGMSICINSIDSYYDQSDPRYRNAFAKITVDIDGPNKGKSIMGRDVFHFSVPGRTPEGIQRNIYPGLTNRAGYFDSDYGYVDNRGVFRNSTCRNQSTNLQNGAAVCGTHLGCNCAYEIYRNNFKLPYNLSNIASSYKQ
ncbi:hypothetical protein IJS77_00135 [bacterium]|nr:hypothetical protein [bacterium]